MTIIMPASNNATAKETLYRNMQEKLKIPDSFSLQNPMVDPGTV
jgi:hypothetical protein